MIRTKTTISGVEFFDYNNVAISQTISENNTASNYIINYDSPYGRHKTDFKVGNEIKIFANQDAAANTNIFTGIVETVTFLGEGLNQKAELRGRDYTARLQDLTVQPVVYTNTEIGSIVRDILKNNTTDIGSVNVGTTTTTLPRIVFNQVPIFDAVKQLADLSNYTFFVDSTKDLNFIPQGSTFANVTLGSGNIIQTTFDKTREGMANKIWVYGDRYLTASPIENLKVGSPTGGSVFTLTNKPFNTNVSILGSVRVGGVFQNQTIATSGTVYLVSFEDKNLIFPSGTTYGYYLPPSGGSIIVNYDRQVPIVKYGEDTNSINAFGGKSLVIIDKSIKDPQTAVSIVNDKLTLTNPFNNIELKLNGWFTFTPGQLVNVAIPDFNLSQSGLQIIEMRYDFDPESALSENVITVRLDKKQIDLTDKIRDIKNQLDAIASSDQQSTDVITRLQYATGSLLIVGSHWEVKNRYFTGSEFRVWGTNFPPRPSGGGTLLGLLYSGAGITGSNSYLASNSGYLDSGAQFDTTVADNDYKGWQISARNSAFITEVIRGGSDTTPWAHIQNTSNSTLASGLFTGSVATFNYYISSGTSYRIVASGPNFVMAYNSVDPPTGITGSNIIFVSGVYGGLINHGARSIVAIRTQYSGTINGIQMSSYQITSGGYY